MLPSSLLHIFVYLYLNFKFYSDESKTRNENISIFTEMNC